MFDEGSLNSAEFIYEKKNTGKTKLYRSLMIALYAVFFLAFFLFCCVTRILHLFAVAPMLLYILILLTWRLVKYDCYWEFVSGKLTVGKVRVGRVKKRVPLVTLKVKDALAIGQFNSLDDIGSVKKIYDFSESADSDKRIYIIFENGGVSSALIVEATAKLARLLSAFSTKGSSVKGLQFHG